MASREEKQAPQHDSLHAIAPWAMGSGIWILIL